jgi:hypothetical protein
VLALALLGALLVGAWKAAGQLSEQPGTIYTTPENIRRPHAVAGPAGTVSVQQPSEGPGWETLNTPQKLALYPLAERWALLSEVQKRRWLALSQTFHTLPEAEQARLHGRMTAWASLSVQQRNQARINFAATQRLTPDDKRSQWDAYQALSEEEKRRLAASAATKPRGAATSIKPVPAKKFTRVPAAKQAPDNVANPPKVPQSKNARPRISAPGASDKHPSDTRVTPTPAHAPAAAASNAADSMAPASAPDATTPAQTGTPADGPSSNIYIN